MSQLSDNGSTEALWQAQERTLTRGAHNHGDVVLGKALRALPSSRPPADFAASVSRAAFQARWEGVSDSWERLMMRALAAAMAVGAISCTLVYGEMWVSAVEVLVGDDAIRWGLAGGACLALSASPWRRALRLAERAPITG